MFKGKLPSTHHATDTTWSKWIAPITQRARTGNPNRPGILEIITNWPEGENFGLTDEEEQEQVTRAEEGPLYNQLPAEETRYALFTDGSCHIVGMSWKWKAAVWSPTRQVAQATEGEGESSQLAELKAVQLALDIAERKKWTKLYLYTDSWIVANALWGWLDRMLGDQIFEWMIDKGRKVIEEWVLALSNMSLTFSPKSLTGLQTPPAHATAAQAATNPDVSKCLPLVSDQQIHYIPSDGVVRYLGEKVTFHAFQESPEFSTAGCTAFPVDVRVAEVPVQDKRP
ncbi:hypothetical protein DUI87_04953 [Hirundo rustica rustica]|uniref:RNase H type-1 domain-containing protein n=1 Tax=Hirundo rustica rustica TaxID=333673 RepID=A0A3M0L2U3_HIRRU|nr:hypothetical protein DUI87_04953 [Hirundo rustica rustica]